MAFVNKKRKTGIELDVVGNINKNDEQKNDSNKFRFEYDIISWEENAIDILNTLDDTGVNIYDETRTPGMYLKTKENRINNVMNIIDSSKTINNNQQQSNNTQNIDFLLDFFDKK